MIKSTTTYKERQVDSDEESVLLQKGRKIHLCMFLQRSDMPLLVLAILSTALSSLASTGLSILIGEVFEVLTDFSTGRYDDFADFDHHLKIACFSITALGAGTLIFSWTTILLWMKLGESQQLRARDFLYSSFFKRSVEWFESNAELNGDIVQVNRCIEELRAGVSECSGIMLQSIFSVIALIVTSLIYSWNLTLVIICSSPIIVAIAWVLNIQIKKFTDLENFYSSLSAKILDFTLSHPVFIKIFNSQSYELARFDKEITESRKAFNRLCFYSSLNVASLRILVLMMFVQAFWYGYHLVKKNSLSSGTVITTFMSCLMLADTAHSIAEQLIFLQKAKVALLKIFSFIGEEHLNHKPREHYELKLYPQTCQGEITFENIHFHYPSRPQQKILNNFNATIPGNKISFIVGKSGCGKSTLCSLLLKHYSPTSGSIKIDGLDITDFNTLWLTDNITVVQQKTTLFTDTLRNNIALGVASKQDPEKISESQLKEAIQFSLLQNMILDLPEGIETLIGLKGMSFSGGQQQRVALARARVRDTPILILDESLSALDTIHKELLISAIKNWRRNKTTIIMTHDFTQIEDEDYVFLVESGELKEEGHKSQLLKSEGIFQKYNNINCFDDEYQITEKLQLVENDAEDYESYFGMEDIELESKVVGTKRVSAFGKSRLGTDLTINSNRRRKNHLKAEDLNSKQTERPEKLESIISIFKFMSRYIRLKVPIMFGLVFALLNGISNPLFSYCFSKLLTSIIDYPATKSEHYILKWAFIVAGIAIGDGISTFLKKFCLGYASEAWIIKLRYNILQKILKQDLTWSDSDLHKPNEISALLMNDSRDMRALVGEFLDVLVTVTSMMTLGLVWSIIIGWKLALVCCSLIPLFILVTSLYSQLLQKQENEYKGSVADLETYQHETIIGMRTIKCLRLNTYFNKNFKRRKDVLKYKGTLRSVGTGFGIGCSNLLMFTSQSIILYYGIKLVSKGEYTTSQFIETLTLLIFTISSASDFMMQIPDMSRAQRLSTYLMMLFSMENSNIEFKGDLKPQTTEGEIVLEFEDVNFKYNSGGTNVLKDVTFQVKRNEILAITGESGCGKSTLVSLILKLQKAENVKLWGRELIDVDTKYLRSNISVVQQTSIFFEGSVKENLLYGLEQQISDETIYKVLREAQIYDFVISLPQGLETQLGNEVNSLVSGGQAQRLSIARALLRDPKILILDECTSALDPVNSAAIKDLIDKKLRLRGMTIIMITHHEEMMAITDRVLVLREGRVQECGRFQDLYSDKNSELVRILKFGK